VAQLNLYVEDALAEQLKQDARREGVSLSSYISKKIMAAPKQTGWPEGYFEAFCGFLKDPNFPDDIADALPSPVEPLDH
jgi:hypothetical protein